MAKLSFKERERRRREKEILKTAARSIRERGFSNLNMDEIAEEVGVSKPTLYQHFDSKHDMVAATMVQSIIDMEAFMETIRDLPPLEQLAQILRYNLTTYRDPDGFPMMMSADDALDFLKNHPAVISKQQEVGVRLYELIQQAHTEGDIPETMPPVVVAGSMFALLSVLHSPDIMHDYSVDADTLVDSIVNVFLGGISAK